MCYQPDPEETQRVVTPIPAVYKRAGYWGVTHVPTDVVWETMEVLVGRHENEPLGKGYRHGIEPPGRVARSA